MTDTKTTKSIDLKHLILFLPMKDEVRAQTLERLDNLTPDQRLQLGRMLWASFFTLFKSQVDFRFQQALVEAQEGKRKLHSKFYQEVEQEVQEEIVQKMQKLHETASLEDVRKDIAHIIKNKQQILKDNPNAVLVGKS